MKQSILFVGPPACGKSHRLKKIAELYPEAPFFYGDFASEELKSIASIDSGIIIVDEVSLKGLTTIDKLTNANRRFYAATNMEDVDFSEYNYITVIRMQ